MLEFVARMTRREFLAGAGAAAGAMATRPADVVAAASRFDGTIRVLGLGYDMLQPILARAQRELGFRIVSTAELGPVIQRWVRQQPGAFDVLSCFQNDIAEFWATGNVQPVQIGRIRRWQHVTPLYKLGKARPGNARCTYGQGDAACRRLYVSPDRSGRWKDASGVPVGDEGLIVQWADDSAGKRVGPEPAFCTGVPGTFNFDSFGYIQRCYEIRPWKGCSTRSGRTKRLGTESMSIQPIGCPPTATTSLLPSCQRIRPVRSALRGDVRRHPLLLPARNAGR